jgi:hypothetical protein
MRIEYKDKCSDYDGHVIDIYFSDVNEAFEIGKIFNEFCHNKKCCWISSNCLRIPLIEQNNIGLAIVPKTRLEKNLEKNLKQELQTAIYLLKKCCGLEKYSHSYEDLHNEVLTFIKNNEE